MRSLARRTPHPFYPWFPTKDESHKNSIGPEYKIDLAFSSYTFKENWAPRIQAATADVSIPVAKLF